MLARQIRVFFLVARWEVYDRLKLHAQALTYDTLLALVPLLAVVLAVIKGFGGMSSMADRIEGLMLSNLAGAPDVQSALSAPIRSFVLNIQEGELGVVSILLLIVSVLSLLGHIEFAFNTIFASPSQRPWLLRVLNYWGILTLGPMLLGASLATSAALSSTRALRAMSDISGTAVAAVHFTPWLLTWVALIALYVLVPQRPVRLSAAVPAAIIAGSLWQGAKFSFAIYTANAFTLHNIYGSLAAVPLFILWLYVSWLLVLFGAQLAYALQHADTYRREDEREPPTQAARELTVCRLFLAIAADFLAGRAPSERQQLAQRLHLPMRLVEELVAHLTRVNLVVETNPGRGLVPGRALDQVRLADVLHGLRHTGSVPQLHQDAATRHLATLMGEFEGLWRNGHGAIDFRALALQLEPDLLAAGATE